MSDEHEGIKPEHEGQQPELDQLQEDLNKGRVSRRQFLDKIAVLGLGFGAAASLAGRAEASLGPDKEVMLGSSDPDIDAISEEAREEAFVDGDDLDQVAQYRRYRRYRRGYRRIYRRGYRRYRRGYRRIYRRYRRYRRGYRRFYRRYRRYRRGYRRIYRRRYRRSYGRGAGGPGYDHRDGGPADN